MKTKKTALYILLVYIAMQLSSIFIIKPMLNIAKMINPDASQMSLKIMAISWTSVFTFFIGFLVTVLLILRDKGFFNHVFKGAKSSIPVSILWGVFGFVLVLVGQSVATAIEGAIGIDIGSENTAQLTLIAQASPIFIIAIVFIGPFLEEVVFRRVIFGSLYQNMSFFPAAFISAIIFSAVHMEFEHLLLYATMGLIFAFLYHKTKRLLTSIIAHTMANGFVILIHFYAEPLQKWLNTMAQFIYLN
ncbi:CPBP family intramembrane glutamic endopeptidase [Kurthia sibirica]|uniref:CPBP family intramembrane metalloprotease n=1 Tax=Kurthia sibirica TaxID=202750 RepID=A0A2U3AJ42_9BACL|nr:CPBP family intramembrane glutamic endopeptidase [Kurthia sibirica]PWI24559.1 CPBP family intramembrane metalloprotease [Kurthia sibirica]GEK33510.1 putative membrane peptidase YdiL [Kurthia sibirica]